MGRMGHAEATAASTQGGVIGSPGIETRDVMAPMRDGVRLAADVWRPDTNRPVPVLVSRTPYGKDMVALMSAPAELPEAGFGVVLQDCRGRFGSEGEWGYVQCEVED